MFENYPSSASSGNTAGGGGPVIHQEELPPDAQNYMGYVATVGGGDVNTSQSSSSSATYGQSFDYQPVYSQLDVSQGGVTSFSRFGTTSMYSPLQPNPSLYAPEDPIFHQSAVHPTPQITTSYSANLFGDLYQMNQSNNYAPSVNNVQQPIIAQLLYNPTNGVDTTSFKKPILSSLRNKTTVSESGQHAHSPYSPPSSPPGAAAAYNRPLEQFSPLTFGSSTGNQRKLLAKPQPSVKRRPDVYVPTPIAELEREKAEREARKVARLMLPRNRSPAADDFSMIDRPKLPVDLADDEILNPRKRPPPSAAVVKRKVDTAAKKGDEKRFTVTTSISSSVSSRVLAPPAKKMKCLMEAAKQSENIKKTVVTEAKKATKLTAGVSNAGVVVLDESKPKTKQQQITTSSTEKKLNATKEPKARLRGTSAVFGAEKPSFEDKLETLTALNSTTTRIADIDRIIAEKERELFAKYKTAINSSSSSTSVKVVPVWRLKLREDAPVIIGKPPSKEAVQLVRKEPATPKRSQFDIDALFGDISDKKDDLGEKRPKVANEKPTVPSSTLSLSTRLLFEEKKKRPPTAMEQMKIRMAAANVSTSASTSKPKVFEALFSKGEGRKARTNTLVVSSSSGLKKLAPLDMYNTKVAYSVRVKYLQRIHEEYQKICTDANEAIDMAVREEKSIADKISTRNAYASAIANTIRRLRECAESGGSGISGSVGGISHSDVLAGRHVGTFSIGVKRSTARASSGRMSETDFYAALAAKYLLTDAQLRDNGFPRWASLEEGDTLGSGEERGRLVTIQSAHPNDSNSSNKEKRGYVEDSKLTRVCIRCGKVYRLTKDGEYVDADTSCVFHWGKAWKKRVNGVVEPRYTCCDQDLSVKGCVDNDRHVTETRRVSELRDFRATPKPFGVGDPRSRKVYAMDCEMVYGTWGPMLARVSVVDVLDELVLDEIVRPEAPLIDCNTRFSGLNREQLETAKCTFDEVRERLFELVNRDTILIGHSLESDLKAMRLVHDKVVDTSVVFPHRLGPPMKRALKTITCDVLQKIIQEDVEGHDSKEDASACMKIMLRKVEKMD